MARPAALATSASAATRCARVMAWVTAVRAQLDERDPVASLVRLATEHRKSGEGAA